MNVLTYQLIDQGPTKRPCVECPFAKGAAAGWLGPFKSPEELHREVMSEQPFACHMTIDTAQESGGERLRICSGSLGYMRKCAKSPRFQPMKEMVRQASTEGIMGVGEFINHHKKYEDSN